MLGFFFHEINSIKLPPPSKKNFSFSCTSCFSFNVADFLLKAFNTFARLSLIFIFPFSFPLDTMTVAVAAADVHTGCLLLSEDVATVDVTTVGLAVVEEGVGVD